MSRQPLFWLSLLAIIFLLLHWYFLAPADDQIVKYANKHTKGLIYLWLFTIIAWHLKDRDALIYWMIGLAGVGLVIQILMEVDWHNLSVFFNHRQDFGFSFTGAGLHSALSIWGFLLFCIFVLKRYSCFIRCIVLLMSLIGLLVLVEALLLAGSRAAWVAIFVAIVMSGILLFYKDGNALKILNNWQWLLAGLIFIVLLGGLVSLNFKVFSDRFASEKDVYGTLLSLDREKIPYTSVGARAHMLLYGLELWQDKPIMGWGVGLSRSLIAKDEILMAQHHPHFHNNYLELLVEQGVMGFLFYLLAFTLLMHGLFKAYSERRVSKDMFYYLIGAWIMILVWSLADSRMVHADVRFILLLLSGITFSAILRPDRETTSG